MGTPSCSSSSPPEEPAAVLLPVLQVIQLSASLYKVDKISCNIYIVISVIAPESEMSE